MLRKIQPIWRRKGYGICLGLDCTDRLTNVRFADELLLVVSSEKQVKQMLEDLIVAAKGIGIELHMGKSKVLTNDEGATQRVLRIGGASIDVLPMTESMDYLGRRLCLGELHDTEIDVRLDKAWRKFMSAKAELCGRHVRLSSRLRLCNAVVTPKFLYGSGTWTLTGECERRIRTMQRRMSRWMLGAGRRRVKANPNDDEDAVTEPEESNVEEEMSHEIWVDRLKRTTGLVEDQLRKNSLDDWCTAVQRKKWRWAGHMARRDDGRWSTRLLGWEAQEG